MSNKIFNSKEEKLDFIIKKKSLNVNEIASNFGLNASSISKMRNPFNSMLKPIHLFAFESAYGIPYKIFKDESINTKEQISNILNEQKKKISKTIFHQNEELLTQLVGDWYAYLYPSDSTENIYEIKTTIYKDGTVMDENQNYGKIYLGKRQSIIIKESKNSQNLVSITFDNMQVPFGMFSFTLVSKKNFVHRKMCSYGFFSKKELTEEVVKKILGNIEKVQLQLDYTFEERLNAFI